MFENLRDALSKDKPEDYGGSELLSQGSSFMNIRGAETAAEVDRLRLVLPLALEDLYSDPADRSREESE